MSFIEYRVSIRYLCIVLLKSYFHVPTLSTLNFSSSLIPVIRLNRQMLVDFKRLTSINFVYSFLSPKVFDTHERYRVSTNLESRILLIGSDSCSNPSAIISSVKQTEACQWRLSKIPKRTAIDNRQLKSRQALSKHNGPEQSLQQSLSFQTHFLLCSIRLVAICPPPMDFPIRLPNPLFSSFLFLVSNLFPVYLFSVPSFSLSVCFPFPFFLALLRDASGRCLAHPSAAPYRRQRWLAASCN